MIPADVARWLGKSTWETSGNELFVYKLSSKLLISLKRYDIIPGMQLLFKFIVER